MERFIVNGQVPSKSNGYRIITNGKYASIVKTKALNVYEHDFFMQCPYRGAMIDERFKLCVDVYYSSDRPDLDNALKAVLDCLQMCKVIKNDRQCVEIIARKFIDKEHPRCEIKIDTFTA